MHIPENYLSPATCGVMACTMVPVWKHAISATVKELPKDKMPLLGVGASLSFLAMMFNVPLVGGTTGHAVGGTLISLLFGPNAACIAVSVALLIQALIFGDGGILSFGANCFNMAFILPYLGYYIYRLIMKYSRNKSDLIHSVAAFVGSYVGINAAAFFAAIEFGIQPMLFKDKLGHAMYCPYGLNIAIPAMMIPHLVVAGVVEAMFTVAVFNFVRKSSPDLIFKNENKTTEKKRRMPVYILVATMVALTPLGLIATGTAWGEWDSSEILNVTNAGKKITYVPEGLKNGWSLKALFPDYAISGLNETIGYILSAILGVAILVIIFKIAFAAVNGNREYDT